MQNTMRCPYILLYCATGGKTPNKQSKITGANWYWTFLALENVRRIVALTGPATEKIAISEDQVVIYSPSTVTITGPGGPRTITVKSYQQRLVNNQNVLEEFTDRPSLPVTNLRGCIYKDDCTAFLIDSMMAI